MLCSGESFREGWRPLPFVFLREALPPRPSWPEGSRRKAPSQKGRGKRGLGSRGASFTSARGGRAPRLRRREAGGQEPLGTPASPTLSLRSLQLPSWRRPPSPVRPCAEAARWGRPGQLAEPTQVCPLLAALGLPHSAWPGGDRGLVGVRLVRGWGDPTMALLLPDRESHVTVSGPPRAHGAETLASQRRKAAGVTWWDDPTAGV